MGSVYITTLEFQRNDAIACLAPLYKLIIIKILFWFHVTALGKPGVNGYATDPTLNYFQYLGWWRSILLEDASQMFACTRNDQCL